MAQSTKNNQETAEQKQTQTQTPQEAKQVGESVAAAKQNDGLKHSKGGTTTRRDVTDMGVPMLQGSPREPQGPEDALGPGPKRGDYTNRIGGSNYLPHQVVAVENAKPGEPTVRVIAQRPFAEDIGEVPDRKGGVDTTEFGE